MVNGNVQKENGWVVRDRAGNILATGNSTECQDMASARPGYWFACRG